MTPEDWSALEERVLQLAPGDETAFDALAADIRKVQLVHNPVVHAFGDAGRYLPISAYRLAEVAAFPVNEAAHRFRSSGTGGDSRATHWVYSLEWYHRAAIAGFEHVIGADHWRVVGCLPAYAPDSSLVAMVRCLMDRYIAGSFIGADAGALAHEAQKAAEHGHRLLLIGAAFGLLDLLENGPVPLPASALVVETGGMKTHRRAMGRDQLHARLQSGFGAAAIGSEYGMCELTSQAWSASGGLYRTPPWMRVRIVDPERPDTALPQGQAGAVAVEDLSNLHTASFLLTGDRGAASEAGFEVLGRLSGRELRGCNFLMET